mgnify:FL=1
MDIASILIDDYIKWKDEPFIYTKEDGIFKYHTFGEFIENTLYLAKGFSELGLNNNKFMIFSENSLNYLLCETAVTSYTGIIINVDKNYKVYDLDNAITKTLPDVFLYSSRQKDIVNKLKEKYPTIKYIELESYIPKIIQIGKSVIKNKVELLEMRKNNAKKCCKIIFTSGSTSRPKPVMISGENIINGYPCCNSRIPMNKNQRDYLFLPLSHVFASCDFYYSLISGKKLYLSSSIKNIEIELSQVKPNFLISVPLICERIYRAVNGESSKLKELYGGELEKIIIGGSKVSKQLKQNYYDAGIWLKEVYGMSEMVTTLSGNSVYDDDIEATGSLYDKYEYKIIDKDEDGIGELIVKKPDPFLGYYNDDDSTKEALDEDGFYHTGDLGKIVDNKFYYKKRKDRIFVLQNGEKVNPKELEALIQKRCHVEKVNIYLNNDVLHAILYTNDLANYDESFSSINDDLPKYKHIKSYEIRLSNERIK